MKDARNTWFELITNSDNTSWDTERRPSRRPARPGACQQEYDNTLKKYRRYGPSMSQRYRAEDELAREVLDSLDDNMEWVAPAALAIKEFADADWIFWRDGWSNGMRKISSALKAASSLTGSEQLVWAAFRMAERIIVENDDEIWPRMHDGEGIRAFEKCIETQIMGIQSNYDAWFCADLSKEICRLLMTDDNFRYIFDEIAAILRKSADALQAEAGWKNILLITAAFACYSGWHFANLEYIWCDEGPFTREGDVFVYDAKGALIRMGLHKEYNAQTLVAHGLMELGVDRDVAFMLARERDVREASARVEMSDPTDAFLCILGITSITHVSEISAAIFYSRPFCDEPGIKPGCYTLERIEHNLSEEYECWLRPENCQDEEPPL